MIIEDTKEGSIYRNPTAKEMAELRKSAHLQQVEGAGVIRGVYNVDRKYFELWSDPERTHDRHVWNSKDQGNHFYWFYWYVRDSFIHPLPYENRGANWLIIRTMMKQRWVRLSGLFLPPPGYIEHPISRGAW